MRSFRSATSMREAAEGGVASPRRMSSSARLRSSQPCHPRSVIWPVARRPARPAAAAIIQSIGSAIALLPRLIVAAERFDLLLERAAPAVGVGGDALEHGDALLEHADLLAHPIGIGVADG